MGLTLERGTVVAARYRLDRSLGQGGMGAVWAATHVVTGKAVALKFLTDPSADDSSKKRLLREARAACSISHPNVVQIHDVLDLPEGAPVLVMDLLHGESLGERLERESTIPVDELVRILIPMVSALEAAHAGGVVHRDIKPDNVFLERGPDGTRAVHVKVLDFGIAKVTKLEDGAHAAETAKLTGTGAMMGTPYYMAPEQVFGEKDVDARTDLWAVGILIYECLTGVRPSDGANLGQILKLVTVGPFKPLLEVAPNVPPALSRIVDSCLERDRNKRVPTARALRESLERFAAGTTLDGAEIQGVRDTVAAPRPRRRWLVPAIAAAVVALTGGGAWVARPQSARPSAATPPSTPAAELLAPPVVPVAPVASANATANSTANTTPSAAPDTNPSPVASSKPSSAPKPSARRGPAPKPAASAAGDRGPGGVVLTAPSFGGP